MGGLHGDQVPDRVVGVVSGEVGHERAGVGVVGGEELLEPLRGVQFLEAAGLDLGQNSVQVKDLSGLGSAIIMALPRGQMCSAPGSRANPPSRAGIVSSL